MGIIRSTYIIDPKGKVQAVIEKVKTKEAAEQVQAILDDA